ncbi:zeta toxin family protein [Solilutibacter pythonis]|uniref:zeta toxin family protein n=1 Tax=Solilutibacter pythonis TaxID=2483112 RepID=UPI0013148BC4
MHGNAVTGDPDALREFHPQAKEFQRTHPYTWSGDIHPDASQWADELLEATVSGRKC